MSTTERPDTGHGAAEQPQTLTHAEIDAAAEQLDAASATARYLLRAGSLQHLTGTPWVKRHNGVAVRTRAGLVAYAVLLCGADTMRDLADTLNPAAATEA